MALRSDSPWLTIGSALPLALLAVLCFSFPLAGYFGHPRGWVLAGLGLFVGSVVLYVKRERLEAPELAPFGLSTWQWAAFMTLLTLSNLPMRVEEGLRGQADFWLRFPQLSLMARGEFPPPAPFHPQGSLFADLGGDYLSGLLSWLAGGGASVLSSGWALEHAMLLSGFFLTFGLGHRRWGLCGGFLCAGFAYYGWTVGGGVGLMEAYSGPGLLLLLTLVLSIALVGTEGLPRAGEISLMLGLGALGVLSGSVLLLLLPALVGAAALVGVGPSGFDTAPVKRVVGYALVGVGVWGLLWMLAFGGLAGTGMLAGVLPGQALSLGLHWRPEELLGPSLVGVLGIAAGVWAVYARRAEAAALWLYGLSSWLAPALIDFGPYQEARRLLLHQSTALAFALCLALALAELWSRVPRASVRVAVALVVVAVCFGGERRIHRAFGELESAPPELRAHLVKPFYPAPGEQLLALPESGLDEDLLTSARVLGRLSAAGDRLLTDFVRTDGDELSEGAEGRPLDTFREAAVLGVAGLRSVGSRLPEGGAATAPERFRTEAWELFWQTGDARLLPAFGARWLLVQRPESRSLLQPLVESGALRSEFEQGECTVYRFTGQPRMQGIVDRESSSFSIEEIRFEESDSGAFAWVDLTLEGPFEELSDGMQEIELRWESSGSTDPSGGPAPLRFLSDSLWGEEVGRHRRLRLPVLRPQDSEAYSFEVRLNSQKLSRSPLEGSEAAAGSAGRTALPPGGEGASEESENETLR